MRVTMVETACENNDERIDSDSDTIEIIVEKGIVVAVLADDPNYEYYLLKLTTSPETIEQRFSDSWGGALIVIPWKTTATCFICAELEKDKITVPEELHVFNK